MKRSLTIAMFGGALVLAAAQACSSEDTPPGSSSGSDASSSSTSSSSSSSSSGDTSSSSSSGSVTNTCTPAGGTCFCGTLAAACPHGGTRDPQYKCPAPRAGSDECVSTCCVGGDASVNPPAEAGADAGQDSGTTDAADAG